MVVSVQKLKALCHNEGIRGVTHYMYDLDSGGNIMVRYTGKKDGIVPLININVFYDCFVDIYYNAYGGRITLFSDFMEKHEILED